MLLLCVSVGVPCERGRAGRGYIFLPDMPRCPTNKRAGLRTLLCSFLTVAGRANSLEDLLYTMACAMEGRDMVPFQIAVERTATHVARIVLLCQNLALGVL